MVNKYEIYVATTSPEVVLESYKITIADSYPNEVVFSSDNNSEVDSRSEVSSGRGKWSGKAEFVLSCLGYAVGLGNVWRFPYLVYSNGGGAFLIPFIIMLVFVGLPCFFMEMIVGQFSGCGPMQLWSIAPLFTGIGLGMVIITILTSISYNIVMGWSFYYLFASWQAVLPWQDCSHYWNTPFCFTKREEDGGCEARNMTGYLWYWWYNGSCYSNETCMPDSNIHGCNWSFVQDKRRGASEEYFNIKVLNSSQSIDETGTLQWQLVLVLFLAWLLCYLCVIKGIKSAGKVVYFTAVFPYVILLILLIRGALLEGAIDGVIFYIVPQWEMLGTAKVWVAAAGQVFFSLSVGMGGLMTFASYNKFNNDIFSDILIVVALDAITSIWAGFAIFTIIGHLAFVSKKEVSDVVQEGPGLAFIAYPEVVTYLQPPQLWSTLFFIMLITLAIDTQMAAIETIMTAISDFLPKLRKWKPLVAGIVCIVLFLLGFTMCTQSGVYWMELMNTYSSGWSLILIATIEVIVFSWFYGTRRLLNDLQLMTGHKLRIYWWILFKIIAPITLFGILIFSIIDFAPMKYPNGEFYPTWSQVLGWMMALVSLVVVPVVSVYIVKESYTHSEYDRLPFYKRLWQLTQATAEWLPAPEKAKKMAASSAVAEYVNESFQDDVSHKTDISFPNGNI